MNEKTYRILEVRTMVNIQNLNNQQANQFNDKLSTCELENVVGGFYSYAYYSPYQYLNSYYWPSTQAILGQTATFQAISDLNHERFLATF